LEYISQSLEVKKPDNQPSNDILSSIYSAVFVRSSVIVKSLIFVVLLPISLSSVFGQTGTIKGRIRDNNTLEPIPYATIYINFTMIGTYSNQSGEFTLENVPLGQHELIVSHAAFQLNQSNIILKDSIPVFRDIKLKGQILNEIMVSSKKDNQWKEQLKRFNLLFFGIGPYSKQCKILNPWVLEFKADNNGSFSAEASVPLNIENLSLGYQLTYQLKQFKTTPTNYTISGVVWFQQIVTVDSALIELWDSRRRDVYLGSQRHLFKAIIDNRVIEEGFEMYKDISGVPDIVRQSRFLLNVNTSLRKVTSADVVASKTGNNQNLVKFPSRTEVHYIRKKSPPKIYRNLTVPISWLEVNGGSLNISNQGIALNPSKLYASGAMSESRVSELLPYDYQPTKKEDQNFVSARKNPSILSNLIEKPYLHTDKSYYYPEETIWFKAYMNYSSTPHRDSLSKVLYVELISLDEKIIARKIYPIDSIGTANGDIKLSSLLKGDYQLRAYTRWMLNYDRSIIFSKAIKVLAVNEVATGPTVNKESLDSLSRDLRVELDRDKFYTGEKIITRIQAFDSYGYPIAANLSMSISGFEHSYPIQDKHSILADFPISEEILLDTTSKRMSYDIQYGIELKGQFLTKKSKPVPAVLTIVQESINDVFIAHTEKNGRFLVSNLQLYDTAKYSILASTIKRKRTGIVTLDSTQITPPAYFIEPLKINIVELTKPIYSFTSDTTLSSRILEEVVVEYKQPKEIVGSAVHLNSDQTISGEILRSNDNGDFLSLLQSRVSGLTVIRYGDPATGIIRKVLKLGGISSFLSSSASAAEPMVMVDGRIIYATDDNTAAEQISTMSVSEIDRIEVLKYGSGAAYGARGANGVIMIYTNSLKPLKSKPVTYDKSKLQPLNIAGYSVGRKFKPENESVVYWNPKLNLTKNKPFTISLVAPNYPSEYLIKIEGVTSEGKAVQCFKTLTIIPRP
jgi:hypothetical protein